MAARKRIYRDKSGEREVWYYQFMLHKRRYVESGFRTRAEAEAAERHRTNELRSKRHRPVPLGYVSFEQWVPKLLEHRTVIGKSPRTVENERRRAMILSRRFGTQGLRNITIADIQDYVAERVADGISSRTVNLELTFLRVLFRHAIEHGAAETNPAREVPHLPPATDKQEVWIPSEQEFLRLVNAAESLPFAYGLVPWLWLRALSGLRPAESFFLEWSDLDFEANLIWVRPKQGNPLKNRRKRRVPMHPTLKPVLLQWREKWMQIQQRHVERNHDGEGGPEHQWVFFNPHDHDAQVSCFRRSFEAAKRKAGLPRLTSYSLRHFFASYCIARKQDLFTVSRWMGHCNTRMVEEVYGHLTEDRSSAEMDRMSAPGEDGKSGANKSGNGGSAAESAAEQNALHSAVVASDCK